MEGPCTPEQCQECTVRVVCRCLQITEDDLLETLSRLQIRSLKDIRQLTGVGDACTACHPRLQQYLAQQTCQRDPALGHAAQAG